MVKRGRPFTYQSEDERPVMWFVSYRGGFLPDNVAQIPLKPLSIQRNDAKGSAT